MWNHTQGAPTLRDCIICIKSVIYNEMCRDAQGYTGSFLAIDGVEFGRGNKIPLWLFGFLY